MLDALPMRPLLAGEEGLRLSLAGARSKVPVVLADGAVALSVPGQPTTHILKPPIARCPGTTENEAFVMRLAAAAGLDAAPVEPRVVRDRMFLLVERQLAPGAASAASTASTRKISAKRSPLPRNGNTPAKAVRPSGVALDFCAASRFGPRSMS